MFSLHDTIGLPDMLQAYFLALLEVTFILASLMVLHSLKQTIGRTAFYLSTGVVMVFSQFVSATGMNISGAYPGLAVAVGPTIYFPSLMAMLLIVYISDGTLEAQQFIVGIMAMAGVFLYLSFLTEKQSAFPGYSLYPYIPKSFLQPLLYAGRNFMLASLLSLLVVFLILPVIYQMLRNRNLGFSVSIFASLVFTEVLDAFFFELVTSYPADQWWETLRKTYLARAFAMSWASILVILYLSIQQVPNEKKTNFRSSLDIIMAFLGSYGQEKRLQAHVREWEGRYKMVVENTNDMILLVSSAGMVLDANRRAIEILQYTTEDFTKMMINTLIKDNNDTPFDWEKECQELFELSDQTPIFNKEWQMITKGKQEHTVDVTVTPINIKKNQAILLVARDITQKKKLEQEREILKKQLIHSQRMEAVGQLAGGIAHDFNNLLHAIQGSLDMLEETKTKHHLIQQVTSNISNAVQRASKLTGQLLGFAKGGKYEITKIDTMELVSQTESLFRPLLKKSIILKVVAHPDPMIVEGDFTQLEQVLLNLLFNAMAALKDSKEGNIILRVEPVSSFTPGWKHKSKKSVSSSQNSSASDPQSFIALRVKDNGIGMDETTKQRIFEPFFTTKKHLGTGMGLAMAYGCVDHHNGWIHVESQCGKGTEFIVFLPRFF